MVPALSTGTPALVAVKGHPWPIEDSFEATQNEPIPDRDKTHLIRAIRRSVSVRAAGKIDKSSTTVSQAGL
tara:strand:+ start:489 stop:701 length:213 start_codon:yes stop_codon:yes gene_type:complete